MLKRYHASEIVKAGTYLCITTGEFVTINGPTGSLPDGKGAQFIAASPIVALLLGPLAGLLFILFLPLAVPMVVIWTLGVKARRALPSTFGRYVLQGHESYLAAGGVSPTTSGPKGSSDGNSDS